MLRKSEASVKINYISISLYEKGCLTYVPLSRTNCQTNLNQILYRPPHQLREGSLNKNNLANPILWPLATSNTKA